MNKIFEILNEKFKNEEMNSAIGYEFEINGKNYDVVKTNIFSDGENYSFQINQVINISKEGIKINDNGRDYLDASAFYSLKLSEKQLDFLVNYQELIPLDNIKIYINWDNPVKINSMMRIFSTSSISDEIPYDYEALMSDFNSVSGIFNFIKSKYGLEDLLYKNNTSSNDYQNVLKSIKEKIKNNFKDLTNKDLEILENERNEDFEIVKIELFKELKEITILRPFSISGYGAELLISGNVFKLPIISSLSSNYDEELRGLLEFNGEIYKLNFEGLYSWFKFEELEQFMTDVEYDYYG